jgi:hypothetical protein
MVDLFAVPEQAQVDFSYSCRESAAKRAGRASLNPTAENAALSEIEGAAYPRSVLTRPVAEEPYVSRDEGARQ